jgi:transketolase
VVEVDGHDHAALLRVLNSPGAERMRPLCVIAHTIKGRGVSFMENQVHWHHGVMNRSQFETAMSELHA